MTPRKQIKKMIGQIHHTMCSHTFKELGMVDLWDILCRSIIDQYHNLYGKIKESIKYE